MKKTISLKIPGSLAERLSAAAEQSGRTKSEILREALDQYLTDSAESDPVSFASLASDLIGCTEGPEDLSSNPDHLEGYGK